MITLTTDPVGLLVNYENEGLTQASPLIAHPVVGSQDTVSVEPIQGGLTFSKWTDGQTSNAHDFLVGTTPATYTAQYVNQPPVAVASVSPLGGVAPLAVQFTGSGSSDPEFTTLTYGWDFGDGGNSTQADPAHTYTEPGHLHRDADGHRSAERHRHQEPHDHRHGDGAVRQRADRSG